MIDERNNVPEETEDQAVDARDVAPGEDAAEMNLPPGPGEGDSSSAQPQRSALAPDDDDSDLPPGPGEGDSSAAHGVAEEQDIEEEASEEAAVSEESAAADEPAEVEDEEHRKDWYILKVQSNRENSICDGLRRRMKIAGLEEYFGDIIVPTEEVREFKDGKARIVKRKLYPGYIVVYMAINDDTWFLIRETPGIGDFTGSAGKPTPMLPHEVERILRLAGKLERPDAKTGPRPLIPYRVGDKVRIEEGNFQNFEGDVSAIDETNGRVTVMIQIFNRTTPVELEHWQVKPL